MRPAAGAVVQKNPQPLAIGEDILTRGFGVDSVLDELDRLVADDQTALSRKGEEILASAPPQIAGRMEVRGLGVIRLSAVSDIPVRIVVDIVPADEVERLPKHADTMLLGLALPVLRLAAF